MQLLVSDGLRERFVRVTVILDHQAISANGTDQASQVAVDPGQVVEDVLAHF